MPHSVQRYEMIHIQFSTIYCIADSVSDSVVICIPMLFCIMLDLMLLCFALAVDALKKWDGECVLRGSGDGLPSYGVLEMSPQEHF